MTIYIIDTRRNWSLLLKEWGLRYVLLYTDVDAIHNGDLIIVHISDCSQLDRNILIKKSKQVTMRFLIVTGDDTFPTKDWQELGDTLHVKRLTQVPYFQRTSDLDEQQKRDLKRYIMDLLGKSSGRSKSRAAYPPGKQPEISEPLRGNVDTVTSVIHRFKNLFSPVLLDVLTLKELPDNSKAETISDVFGDHFAPGATAYLSEQSRQHDGADILSYVDVLFGRLDPPVRSALKRNRAAITKAVKSARKAFKKHFREYPVSFSSPGVRELDGQLQSIADAGDTLVEVLREIRKNMQGKVK